MNNQPVFEILRAEVERTRQEYAKSNEHFGRVCGEVPSGGRQIELAARDQTVAMLAYTMALRQFNKFLLDGKVPDELNGSTEEKNEVSGKLNYPSSDFAQPEPPPDARRFVPELPRADKRHSKRLPGVPVMPSESPKVASRRRSFPHP
jgi:hypothetical protein